MPKDQVRWADDGKISQRSGPKYPNYGLIVVVQKFNPKWSAWLPNKIIQFAPDDQRSQRVWQACNFGKIMAKFNFLNACWHDHWLVEIIAKFDAFETGRQNYLSVEVMPELQRVEVPVDVASKLNMFVEVCAELNILNIFVEANRSIEEPAECDLLEALRQNSGAIEIFAEFHLGEAAGQNYWGAEVAAEFNGF
jgi:hypothetical protein